LRCGAAPALLMSSSSESDAREVGGGGRWPHFIARWPFPLFFFSSFCPFLKSLVVNFSARSPSAHRAGVLCCAVFPLFFSDAPKMLVSWWWERAAEGAERNGTERSRAWAPGRAGGASASVALLQVGAVPESLFSPLLPLLVLKFLFFCLYKY
jgi:hypothetical protein